MRRTFFPFLAIITTLAGCAYSLSPERQQKLDGLVVFGWVNVSPDDRVTKDRWSSALSKQSCQKYPEAWCSDPAGFDFVSAMLANTYWGGLRFVGAFVPKSEHVKQNDIVVVRLRAGAGGEFVRVASRGEREDCRWVGGGVTRALTAAGVVCEAYDWRSIAPLLYN
jgi:hypothetical protein